MKILAITPHTEVGGSEKQGFQRYQRYSDIGIEVEIVVMDTEGPLSSLYKQTGIVIHRPPNTLSSILWRLRKDHYDIVETYGQRAHLIGRICTRLGSPSTKVISLKTSVDAHWSSLNKLLESVTSSLVDRYVSNTVAGKKNLEEIGIPSSKIVVIPNGIDLTRFNLRDQRDATRRATRNTLQIPEDTWVIICIATLRPVKNHVLLLQAFTKLLEKGVQTKLLLVGDGLLKYQISGLIYESNLQDNVFMLGTRADVPQLLAASDILVLCSKWEGMPGALMEGMAAELPTISTNVGGVPELISHGKTGILINPEDFNALYDALILCYTERKMAQTLGRNAREYIEHFSVEHQVNSWLQLYSSLGLDIT